MRSNNLADTLENIFLAAGIAQRLAVPAGTKWAEFEAENGNDFYAAFYRENDDIVVNGDFAADTDWPVQGTGWTISGGTASSDATQGADSDLTQTPAGDDALVPGQAYDVTFTVSSYVAGNVVLVLGETEGTDRGADGTFTETIIAGAGADIDIRADVTFNGSADLLSIKKTAQVPAANLTGDAANEINPRTKYISGVVEIGLVSEAENTVSVSFGSADPGTTARD